MQTQYTVLGYRIDLYFHEYKLAIEVDELGHNDRNIDYEIQRHRALKNLIVQQTLTFVKKINKIHRHIKQLAKQQTEQKTKKSLIDNLSKGLLELEFKQNNQIKTKCLKWIVKNILPNYKL